MRLRLSSLIPVALLATFPGRSFGQTLPPPAHQRLARDIFRELIEINTIRDSGATRAARARWPRGSPPPGFPPRTCSWWVPARTSRTWSSGFGAAGRAKPILFLAHLDVVEARTGRTGRWIRSPSPSATGTSTAAAPWTSRTRSADLVANLLRLKAEGYVPQRDILVALTDDEEGGDDNGVSWLLEHRPDADQAAYVINHRRRRRPDGEGTPAPQSGPDQRKDLRDLPARGHQSRRAQLAAARRTTRSTPWPGRWTGSPGSTFPVRLNPTTRAFFRAAGGAGDGAASPATSGPVSGRYAGSEGRRAARARCRCTTPPCAPPASPPCFRPATRRTPCPSGRRPRSSAASSPATRPSEVRDTLVAGARRYPGSGDPRRTSRSPRPPRRFRRR